MVEVNRPNRAALVVAASLWPVPYQAQLPLLASTSTRLPATTWPSPTRPSPADFYTFTQLTSVLKKGETGAPVQAAAPHSESQQPGPACTLRSCRSRVCSSCCAPTPTAHSAPLHPVPIVAVFFPSNNPTAQTLVSALCLHRSAGGLMRAFPLSLRGNSCNPRPAHSSAVVVGYLCHW